MAVIGPSDVGANSYVYESPASNGLNATSFSESLANEPADAANVATDADKDHQSDLNSQKQNFKKFSDAFGTPSWAKKR